MQSNNNINTGLAQKIDAFRWSQSTDNKPHVVGVKVSAPDYSIPPTPASSYANIHVVLDTIHPSSAVMTSTVLAEPVKFSTPTTSFAPMESSRSFSSLPREENSFLNNRLDDVPSRSFRAVPDRIDPEQPGARSAASLTSLKSEIAPMPVPFVPLEEFDELSERTDRELPPSVDISLVDESASFRSTYPRKQWALMEEEERSWRMSRPVDNAWKSKWNIVGSQLLQRGTRKSSSRFSLRDLEESERSWRMSRPVDNAWKSKWNSVGSQLLQRGTRKSSSKFSLGDLEESERQWRMSRPVDALWSGRIHEVGYELTNYTDALKDLSQWADNLKLDLAKQTAEIIRNVNNIKPEIRKMQLAELELERNLNRRRLAETRALEEKERAYRINRGVDPVFSGRWHSVGLEVASLAGVSWSEWFSNLKNKTLNTTRQAVKEIKKVELPSMPEMRMPTLPEISLPSMPAMPAMNLPDLKLGVVRSEATLPLYDDAELVDFTFKKNRISYDLMSRMEEERAYRLKKGVNPVLYGLWFRLGQELKYKYSLRPTLEGVATKLAEKASGLASKTEGMIESLVETARDTMASVQDSLTPAPAAEFAEHKHLNLFAFTAEKIDFTFKKNRTPASIIALEEAERLDRIRRGYDRARYARWNSFLLASLPKTSETLIEKVEKAAEAAVDTAKTTLHTSAWGNYLGSLAHNVADATTHFVEVAKESLHMAEHALPSSSVSAAEEAERLRRMNAKVDPMTAARMGRVQDELLNFSVKSKN